MSDEYVPIPWPAWRYHVGQFGRVEGKIFDCAEDVPPGWVEKAEDAKPKSQAKAPARKRKARKNAT